MVLVAEVGGDNNCTTMVTVAELIMVGVLFFVLVIEVLLLVITGVLFLLLAVIKVAMVMVAVLFDAAVLFVVMNIRW
jgi:hypothetical protein